MTEQRKDDAVGPSTSNRKLPRGFGKIVRDASGNVIDVQLEEETEGLMEDETMGIGGQPESWLLGNRAGGDEAEVVRGEFRLAILNFWRSLRQKRANSAQSQTKI